MLQSHGQDLGDQIQTPVVVHTEELGNNQPVVKVTEGKKRTKYQPLKNYHKAGKGTFKSQQGLLFSNNLSITGLRLLTNITTLLLQKLPRLQSLLTLFKPTTCGTKYHFQKYS